MMALFLLVFFISWLKRYYTLISMGVLFGVVVILYISFFADNDFREFVIDTITFQDPSSFGHLINWIQGVESMIDSRLGLGLGSSGSGTSVESDLWVG